MVMMTMVWTTHVSPSPVLMAGVPAVKVAPTPNTATQFMAHPRGAASARTVPQINRFIIYRVQN